MTKTGHAINTVVLNTEVNMDQESPTKKRKERENKSYIKFKPTLQIPEFKTMPFIKS